MYELSNVYFICNHQLICNCLLYIVIIRSKDQYIG